MLVRLQPDIVKLDKELVQALPGRVAVTSGRVGRSGARNGPPRMTAALASYGEPAPPGPQR